MANIFLPVAIITVKNTALNVGIKTWPAPRLVMTFDHVTKAKDECINILISVIFNVCSHNNALLNLNIHTSYFSHV